MPQWDENFPEKKVFLYNIQRQLSKLNFYHIEALLTLVVDCSAIITASEYLHDYMNYGVVTFYVPIDQVQEFTPDVLKIFENVIYSILPTSRPFYYCHCDVSPVLELPPEDEPLGLNVGNLVSKGAIEHDKLRFRSKTETKIYEALKKHKVLFFPNAAAVLGGQKVNKREPDFLICQDGKWGILEIMGDPYHTAETATKEHERARLFKEYGIFLIEFYPADRCYNESEKVVSEFLTLLAKQKS